MLSKGLKDEIKEKIDKMLVAMVQMGFVPEDWESSQRELVNTKLRTILEIDLDEIEEYSVSTFLNVISEKNLDAEQVEKLGDLILDISALEPLELEPSLAEKALKLFEKTQQESNTFSMELVQKINLAKSLM